MRVCRLKKMRGTGLLKSTQNNHLGPTIKKRMPDVINSFVTNGIIPKRSVIISANSNYLLSNTGN